MTSPHQGVNVTYMLISTAFNENPSVWGQIVPRGHTNFKKLRAALCNCFAKAPKRRPVVNLSINELEILTEVHLSYVVYKIWNAVYCKRNVNRIFKLIRNLIYLLY